MINFSHTKYHLLADDVLASILLATCALCAR